MYDLKSNRLSKCLEDPGFTLKLLPIGHSGTYRIQATSLP